MRDELVDPYQMADNNIQEELQKGLELAQKEKMKLEALRKQIYQEIQDASKQAKSRLDATCIELLQKQKKIDELIHKITQNQQLL